MPDISAKTPQDRAQHALVNTRMRRNADVILQPDDILENAGSLTTVNRDGNPVGLDGEEAFQVISLESPDGWFAYLGREPQGVNGPTKQSNSPLPISRHSFLANQPLIQGDLPPSNLAAARIERPLKPLLVAETVGIEGYAAATETSPYFVALTYAIAGRHSLLSPPVVVPPVANGQSIKVILFDSIPEGVTQIGVWLTEPSTSTSTVPGPFWLQREVDVQRYNPSSYDLTGPYRFDKKELTKNETALSAPGQANLTFLRSRVASRPGTYRSRVWWASANGESLPGPESQTVTITVDSRWDTFNDQGELEPSIAGYGFLRVLRPFNPPPGAIGWYAGVYVEGSWNVIYYSRTGEGNEKPLPLSKQSAITGGWSSGSENDFARLQTEFLVSRDLPTENTSGVEDPTDTPSQPVVIGTVRPPAGDYYAFSTYSLRGWESKQSPTSNKLTLANNQIPRLININRVNRIPNGDNSELVANGLPLDQTIVSTNGVVFMDGSDVILRTTGSQTGTTPSNTTRPTDVPADEHWRARASIAVENPTEGALQGSSEVVLVELSVSGAQTLTVLDTISAVGDIFTNKIIYAAGTTGLPGGSIIRQATTVQAALMVRYSGTNKNLTIRIRYRELHDSASDPKHRIKLGQFYPDNFSELPASDDAGVFSPMEVMGPPEPVTSGSPALIEWPTPNRPSSSGSALETKHTFESAFPAGWTQHVSGATLTRASGSVLTGTYSMRSYKAS